MPTFELHADYDRDGRISGTSAEHHVRARYPGALLVANLDVDARVKQKAGKPVLDKDLEKKAKRDDQLAVLSVKIAAGTAASADLGFLSISERDGTFVRALDPSGKVVLGRAFSAPGVTEIITRLQLNAAIDLRVEAVALWASPKEEFDSINVPDPGAMTIFLTHRRSDGSVINQDYVSLTITPILFPDPTLPAEEFYICTMSVRSDGSPPPNDPTVRDLDAALLASRVGVPVVKVPQKSHSGDTWLQDQFQVGYCYGTRDVLPVALHLPRLRSNHHVLPDVPNLAGWVTTHFPSSSRGLCHDLWERSFPFDDWQGRTHRLSFPDTAHLFALLVRVRKHWMQAHAAHDRFREALQAATASPPGDADDAFVDAAKELVRFLTNMVSGARPWSTVARALLWLAQVKRLLPVWKSLVAKVFQAEAREMWNAEIDNLDVRLTELEESARMRGTAGPIDERLVTVAIGTSRKVDLLGPELERLDADLYAIHSSGNYGGNLVPSPPVKGAPWGKLVVGKLQDLDGGYLTFLNGQRRQPIVSIDTSWLEVGHVDEMVAFARGAKQKTFCTLVASPRIALAILREAFARHLVGASILRGLTLESARALIDKRDQDAFDMGDPSTSAGTFPITKLLRGKWWIQDDGPESVAPIDPPGIYRAMAQTYAGFMRGGIRYLRGEGKATHPAALSVRELLQFEVTTAFDKTGKNAWLFETNRLIGKNIIEPLSKALQTEFPDAQVLELPVIFDRPNVATEMATSAFTPDLVNIQVIDGHVFMPRPYGPRVSIDHAIAVLETVFDLDPGQFGPARKFLTRTWVRKRGLVGAIHWASGKGPFGESDLDDIAGAFADGFPGVPRAKVAKAIRDANRGRFSGIDRLDEKEWQRIAIPEATVDLFEVFSDALLFSRGLQIHWIDTWFYHLHVGELHCGSNVVRSPHPRARRRWWETEPASTQIQAYESAPFPEEGGQSGY